MTTLTQRQLVKIHSDLQVKICKLPKCNFESAIKELCGASSCKHWVSCGKEIDKTLFNLMSEFNFIFSLENNEIMRFNLSDHFVKHIAQHNEM
ncbi:MAG: hypothetical protein WCP19_01950, partial [Chloroflexota bacterium]